MIWQRDPGDEDDAPLKRLELELARVLAEETPPLRQRILEMGWPIWLADFYGASRSAKPSHGV